MLKKILKFSGIFLLVLFIVALILPFLFKNKIIAKVKEEANKSLNAKLDFTNLDISFIRSFPNCSVELEGLSLIGMAEFKSDTLIAAKSLGITTDILSIIGGNEIGIKSIFIDQARIHLKVLKDGKANWDITKPSNTPETPSSEPSTFKAKLQHYSINSSRIWYEDQSMNFSTIVDGLNHEGSGDFTADNTKLETQTTIDSLDVNYGGVAYLKRANIDYKADFDLDLKNSIYAFKENELRVNNLALKFAGSVKMPANDITLDITYEALKNEVKNFISIVPGAFTKDFENVKSSGKLAFNGFVKGVYNEKCIPGFGFNLQIENGSIQYPGLPRAISNIQVITSITCPGVDADKTQINVSRLHVDLGQFPIDARILVSSPVSDPNIDASVKGRVDLSTLKDLMPLEAGTRMNGIASADVTMKGRMSSIDKGQYEQFAASGTAGLERFQYASKDLPQDVMISKAALTFNPKSAELSQFDMTIGKSDVHASGSLENYIAYVMSNQAIKGNLNLSSRFLDSNPFMTTEASTSNSSSSQPADVAGYIRVPSNIDFTIKANIQTLLYDNMRLEQVNGTMLVRNEEVKLEGLKMNTLGGSITLAGLYETRSETGPAVAFQLDMNALNVKETAKTFSTVKQLAPIAEHTSGTVSVSGFNFSCKADKAFNPDLKTVNGSGTLKTSMLEIEGFEMIKKIAGALKMDKLKKWKMEPFQASFTIEKGNVTVKPFKTKVGNYTAEIGGQNGLDKSINYAIHLEIPRAEFGGDANAVLNGLLSKANAQGVKAELGDVIPVAIKVTGTFADPKVSTDIRNQANNAMNDLKKQAEQRLKEEAERQKKELQDKANAEKERLKKEAENRINQEKDKLKSEAEKAKSEAERRAKEEVEKAKKKAADEAKKGLDKFLKGK
jgi:uncharacterized protein involved in outer membrane biogenesis